jgi:hypothetical protein
MTLHIFQAGNRKEKPSGVDDAMVLDVVCRAVRHDGFHGDIQVQLLATHDTVKSIRAEYQ